MKIRSLLLFILALTPLTGNTAELWRLGATDRNWNDFAIAGDHQAFMRHFAAGVSLTVNQDNPAEAWPYIHPGPEDAWAGGRPQVFKINFSLEAIPESACRFTLALAATHPQSPPRIMISVNGHASDIMQLAAGSSDAALSNPEKGNAVSPSIVFPSAWLQLEHNQIEIANLAGSWMLYDSMVLEDGVSPVPEITRFEAESTLLFKEVDGAPRQAVRVRITNQGLAGEGTLSLAGTEEATQPVTVAHGDSSLMLLVPPFTKKEWRQIVLETGNTKQLVGFDASPERQWTLFVAPSAHTDIGYTDLQEKCMALHADNARSALDEIAKKPLFKWNLEVFAQYDWFKQQYPERVEELDRQIQNGKIGLTAFYLNMLTGLCSGSEMMHLLAPAQATARRLGVPVQMASMNDIPAATGTLPMFLRHAGVRYFAEALNEDRGPVFRHCDPEMNQSPFWWEAPDGSRVLTIFTRTYFQAMQIHMHENTVAMEEALPAFLKTFIRYDYPGDALFINGAYLDNWGMNPVYGKTADEWNRSWASPKIKLATAEEYFRYIEENFAQDLPVYKGTMGGFWEDGAASTAKETAQVRWSKNLVSALEKWEALAAIRGLEAEDGAKEDALWSNILYYDEHTWGSAVSISDPDNPQSTGQWARKASYSNKAYEESATAAKTRGLAAITRLAGLSGNSGTGVLTVVNSFSWDRDIPVSLPAGTFAEAIVLKDVKKGKKIVPQQTSAGGFYFVAEDVPALGWRSYEILTGSSDNAAPLLTVSEADPYSFVSRTFAFHINPQTGGLDRLTNLEAGDEWVDQTSGYHLNQFIHVEGGSQGIIYSNLETFTDFRMISPTQASVSLVENGPERAVLQITSTGGFSHVDTQLIVHKDGTLDFINTIHKTETLKKEGGYFAFPFNMNTPDRATAYMEAPYGVFAADQDYMPGACREWHAVQHFAAVDDGTRSAYIAAPDTPLFTVGDVNRGVWPNRLKGNRHILFAYVYNNYWHTNYKASQGGDLRCAFSLKLNHSAFDAADATRFGWARSLDMTPGVQNVILSESSPENAQTSMITLSDKSVILSELLPLPGGKRMLARFYNPSPVAARTTLKIRGVTKQKLYETDLFGENGKEIPAVMPFSVPPHGIKTLVLEAK